MSVKQQQTSKLADQKTSHKFIGQRGEQTAAQFLESHNHSIWEYNWSVGHLEIDLIAFDHTHQEIVFAEVKTRRKTDFGHPSSAVDWQKKYFIETAAQSYLALQKQLDYDYRFDILTVVNRKVEWFQNVTWW